MPIASVPRDASLRRLGIDEIDLYQVHAPDPEVPLEQMLQALDGLVRSGKVRALCVSNFAGWLLAWAVAPQDREGWTPFVSRQPQYSLDERSVELDLLPFCRAAGLGVLPGVRSAPGSSAERTGATRRRRRRAARRRRATTGTASRTRKLRSPSLQWRSPGCSVSTV